MTTAPEAFRVKDHNELFDSPEYAAQFERKREFEEGCSSDEVERVKQWTRTWEYREKNFAREALTVNPAKACQPLGAVLASLGFAGTLPLVHGSQGCVAYFRSHFARHFKEPCPTVSSSMTEDAAVFGGLNNMVEALDNATALYKPDMIAVSTTCMAEVIGDDLHAFIETSRERGSIPADYPVPFAHTPSFVGSHLTGYDNMLRAILEYLARDVERKPHGNGRLNIVPGFDTYVGDHREIKRILALMGVDHLILGDHSASMDSPADGEYVLYPGGTPLDEAADAINANGTIFLQEFASRKTAELVRHDWGQPEVVIPTPIGVRNTDRFITEVARLAGVTVPDEITAERGRLVDALTDSHAYLHGKRVAIAGDPDIVLGTLGFLLELGMEPVHVLSTNGDAAFESHAQELLASSPFGAKATVWAGKDLWHLRSLVFTEPVDLLVGNSYLKYLSRESDTPLVRVGFPIFDRHHLHRFPIIGYAGGLHLLTQLVNTVLDRLDREAPDHSYDAVR
ncbi:nitrogenase molybdenum-iron protein subunit beta [Thermopolyspora sp. NPDC052614]|uniref:nitrogenase molybdenum-iron protein subunit beta n=1 Tax=Thermopolyspora sp. NPDC052614 TaxID=3155682 RepID=UPI00343DCF2C